MQVPYMYFGISVYSVPDLVFAEKNTHTAIHIAIILLNSIVGTRLIRFVCLCALLLKTSKCRRYIILMRLISLGYIYACRI